MRPTELIYLGTHLYLNTKGCQINGNNDIEVFQNIIIKDSHSRL